MRESRTYGSVRGALRKERPYRERPCAAYRKITNGFRQDWGAHLYADIRSVIETARRRSIRAIDAIRLTLKGEPIRETIQASS